MADVKINLPTLNRDVLVTVPDGGDLAENFNEAASFVQGLEARSKIRDREQGINPPGATHEIVRQGGDYRLQRFRIS